MAKDKVDTGAKKRRTGVRIPGVSAMALACGVSHTHMRFVRLGVRTPSRELKAKIEAYMEAEREKKKNGGTKCPRRKTDTTRRA